MICENCNCNHDGKYGSGRFCSSRCARSFSSKEKREEINKKVSKTLKRKIQSGEFILNNKDRYLFTDKNRIKSGENRKNQRICEIEKLYKEDWSKLVNKYSKKVWKYFILKEQNNKCAICSCSDFWNNKKLTLQLDHIDGDRYNNQRENLRMVCPNCHSQTETFCSKNIKR